MSPMIDIAIKGHTGGFALDTAFIVPASGICCIRGASGSGKTTLLRAIAGLVRIEGHVRIGETVWQDGRVFVPVHKRRAGLVFQDASLFAHLGVRGNLEYARKRNGGEAVNFDGIVDWLGVQPLLGRGVADLSGGESQRVALARTLLSAPDLLLMDEPLSSLDSTAKDEILPLIKEIGSRVPVLYVSHDAAEAAALADRTLRMDNGRIHTDDETAKLDGLSDAQVRTLAEAALRAGIRP